MIAAGGRRRRPADRAHRDVRDRLLDAPRARSPRTRAARASSSCSTRPREHDAWLIGSIAQRGTGRRVPQQRRRWPRPDGSVHRYAKIHPFSYAGEHEHYAAGDELLTVDDRRAAGQRVRLLRPALRRRVLGPGRTTPTCTSCRPTGPSRGASTGGRCCGPGRSRTRPTWSASTGSGTVKDLPHVGDSAHHRSAGPHAGRGQRRRDGAGRRGRAATRYADVRSRFPFLADRR